MRTEGCVCVQGTLETTYVLKGRTLKELKLTV
jgi:hypothetical protein